MAFVPVPVAVAAADRLECKDTANVCEVAKAGEDEKQGIETCCIDISHMCCAIIGHVSLPSVDFLR